MDSSIADESVRQQDTTIVRSPKRRTCYKSIILVILTTTLLTGIVVVGTAAVTKVVPDDYLDTLLFKDVVPEFQHVLVAMLAIGGCLVALSLFSCFGVYNEITWIIFMMWGLVPLLMIAEISVATLTFFLEGKASGWLDQNIDCMVCSKAVDHAFHYIVTPAILLLVCVALQLAIVLCTCKLLQFIDRKQGKSRLATPRLEPRVTVQPRADVSTHNVTMLEMTDTSPTAMSSGFKLRVPRWKKRNSQWKPPPPPSVGREPYAIAYPTYRQQIGLHFPNTTDENKFASVGDAVRSWRNPAEFGDAESIEDNLTSEPSTTSSAKTTARETARESLRSVKSLGDSVKKFVRSSFKNRTITIRSRRRASTSQTQDTSPPSAMEIELEESAIKVRPAVTYAVAGPSQQTTFGSFGVSRQSPALAPSERLQVSSGSGQSGSRQAAPPVQRVDALTPPVESRFV